MHRDLKLGLALAVLLMGSTAAFFFRNDADPDAGLPQLKHAEELDRAVAARDAAPYFPSAEARSASAETTAESPWAKPAFLGGSFTSLVGSTAITPDPIQIVMEEELESAPPAPVAPTAPVSTPVRDADGTPIYVVQSGDTLSGIAGRYLGSIARFDEIYELNRDQLSGPHALKIGMRLKLPSEAPEHPAPQAPAGASASDVSISEVSLAREASEENEIDDASPTPLTEISEPETASPASPSAEGLFKPAKRTPFVPSRYRAPQLAK